MIEFLLRLDYNECGALRTDMGTDMIGNYRCAFCTLSFNREARLQSHINETHGISHPHQCLKNEGSDTFTTSSFMLLLEVPGNLIRMFLEYLNNGTASAKRNKWWIWIGSTC